MKQDLKKNKNLISAQRTTIATHRYLKVAKIFGFLIFCFALYVALFSETDFRTYWSYIIASYALAIAVWLYINRDPKNTKKGSLIDFLFSSKIWLHRSSKEDYYIITINYFLAAYLFQYVIGVSDPYIDLSPYINIITPFLSYLHVPQYSSQPSIFVVFAFSASVFIASDLMYFLAHRLMHKSPSLWEFHKVHHSAEVMTPLTVHRVHPVERAITLLFRVPAQLFVSLIFLYIFPNLQMFAIVALVNGAVIFFDFTLANLRHSHVWISYGPRVEKLLLSPAQHQIHHSTQRKHFDKNFGSSLAIWDWIFNSLYVTTKREDVVFGLGEEKQDSSLDTIWGLYWTPFMRSFKTFNKIKPKLRK